MTHHTVAHPPIMNHAFTVPLPPHPAVHSPLHGRSPVPIHQVHSHPPLTRHPLAPYPHPGTPNHVPLP